MPSELPSDIRSVRVTTDMVAEKEGDEPTLAVHVIVDRSVPPVGWVLMVAALLGLAAMVGFPDIQSYSSRGGRDAFVRTNWQSKNRERDAVPCDEVVGSIS